MKQNFASQWRAFGPHLLSMLRIASAFIFIQSGTMKLFGFPAPLPNGMHIELWSQAGIGGLLDGSERRQQRHAILLSLLLLFSSRRRSWSLDALIRKK